MNLVMVMRCRMGNEPTYKHACRKFKTIFDYDAKCLEVRPIRAPRWDF